MTDPTLARLLRSARAEALEAACTSALAVEARRELRFAQEAYARAAGRLDWACAARIDPAQTWNNAPARVDEAIIAAADARDLLAERQSTALDHVLAARPAHWHLRDLIDRAIAREAAL